MRACCVAANAEAQRAERLSLAHPIAFVGGGCEIRRGAANLAPEDDMHVLVGAEPATSCNFGRAQHLLREHLLRHQQARGENFIVYGAPDQAGKHAFDGRAGDAAMIGDLRSFDAPCSIGGDELLRLA